jgi:hypothetical protein
MTATGMDFPELMRAVEQALQAATGEPLRLSVVWVAPDTTASYIVRVEQTGSNRALPRSLIVKAANPELAGDPQQMIFNEWAALQYLDELHFVPRVSARFYAGVADRSSPFIVMEDLGSGDGSPYEMIEGNDPEAAEKAILEYARTLGRLHGCGAARPERFRELRNGLPEPPRRRPLFHDPWPDACSHSPEEIRRAIAEYRAVLSGLGVPLEPGIDDEIEEVTYLVEEHQGEFLTLCQGDQNSTRQCIRQDGAHRMIDFGVAGLRHALIEGIPHRMTWGCINRMPKRLFLPFEEAYRKELSTGCPAARNESRFREAMVEAAARWSVFHMIWRVPDAMKADRPRGAASLRQQLLAWLSAFIKTSEEFGRFPALGKSAHRVRARLRSQWPSETHNIPLYPAFQRAGVS